jgi:hypothetical protein
MQSFCLRRLQIAASLYASSVERGVVDYGESVVPVMAVSVFVTLVVVVSVFVALVVVVSFAMSHVACGHLALVGRRCTLARVHMYPAIG